MESLFFIIHEVLKILKHTVAQKPLNNVYHSHRYHDNILLRICSNLELLNN